MVQVGLHNLPMERQLQVSSPPMTEKEICNVIFNDPIMETQFQPWVLLRTVVNAQHWD